MTGFSFLKPSLVPALLLAIVAPTGAEAAVEQCGERVAVTRAILDQVADYRTARLGGDDALLAVQLEGGEGVVTFVRRAGRWRGYGVASTAGIQQVYRSAAGDVFVWAYEGLGDPPHSFSAFRVGARPGSHFCTQIDVPAILNRSDQGQRDWQGEAFSFDAFNVTASGAATVIGSADFEEGGRAQSGIFSYSSRDGGRRWAAPVRIAAATPPDGIYRPAGEQDESLLADLRSAAAR